MTQRLTKLEAAARLGVSPSTIDRMIRRNELAIEKEVRGTRYKVWVLTDASSPDGPAEKSRDFSVDSADVT